MTLLHRDPDTVVRSLAELADVALALETQAQRRYDELARILAQRGESTVASLLRELAAAAGGHAAQASGWRAQLGAEPPARSRALPSEIADAWDELARSALLTPLRVLAQAVTGERRVFVYYSYLAARAVDPAVRQAAERLAGEALRRAAQLRRHRREAWRRERRSHPPAPATTPEELVRQAAPLLAEAAAAHAALAAAPSTGGDVAAADLLQDLAQAEAREAGVPAPEPVPPPRGLSAAERRRRALMPLERLSELYEAAAERASSEAMLAAAQAGLELTVARLRRVASVL